MPNSVVIKTILRKSTGNISAMSFDRGEGLTEKAIPFDTFMQIIDGKAEYVINGESNILVTGQVHSNTCSSNKSCKSKWTIQNDTYSYQKWL